MNNCNISFKSRKMEHLNTKGLFRDRILTLSSIHKNRTEPKNHIVGYFDVTSSVTNIPVDPVIGFIKNLCNKN